MCMVYLSGGALVFKATVSFDGFIEKIKAPSQYAADLKVTDAIIYLCKMRGTFSSFEKEPTRQRYIAPTRAYIQIIL